MVRLLVPILLFDSDDDDGGGKRSNSPLKIGQHSLQQGLNREPGANLCGAVSYEVADTIVRRIQESESCLLACSVELALSTT